MALRFNPPPNWPAPPEGFEPPPGWQPDPAWGPAPEGWQIWVDDSAPSAGTAGAVPTAASGADPAWAPTQAVAAGTSGPVADPTGVSASAPSGDYSAGAPAGPAPAGAASGPGVDYAQAQSPFASPSAGPVPGAAPPGAVPSAGPVPGAAPGGPAPVGAGPAGPAPLAPGAGWQPGAPGSGLPGAPTSRSVYKRWWFWASIIAVVLVVVLVVALLLVNNRNNDDSDDTSGNQGLPTSQEVAMDPEQWGITIESPSDSEETVTLQFDSVNWDAYSTLEDSADGYYSEPDSDEVYITVEVTLTYHGSDYFDRNDLRITYNQDGSTTKPEEGYDSGELYRQMRYIEDDGDSVKGFVAFLIDKDAAESGSFVVSYDGSPDYYVQAK